MKNAVLLHGRPSREEYYDPEQPALGNAHWFPWLQKQLIIKDIPAQTPEVPNSFNTDYEVWCKEFERYDIGSTTLLVGHSCGGGFIVRWLSEHPEVSVAKVVLVAPWLDPDREFNTGNFFDFEIDPGIGTRAGNIVIFNSSNDGSDIHKSVEMLRRALPGAKYHEFQNYGHFCIEDMKTEVFPELLEECLA